MSHAVTVGHGEGSVTIVQLTVRDAEFFKIAASEPPESQTQAVLDVIAAGTAAIRRHGESSSLLPEGQDAVGGVRSMLARIRQAANCISDIQGKASLVQKFAQLISADANGSEGTILRLVEEVETALHSL